MNKSIFSIKVICVAMFILLPAVHADESGDTNRRHESHDYVIVGGGTAGLTLAYLMDKDGLDVVVLEAGADRDDDPNIRDPKPIGALESGWRNEYFWLENGKPQTNLPNDEAHYSGGRILGGSSAINDSIYWRGMQRTYDKWGGVFADAKYVQRVFRESETFIGRTQDTNARGSSGPFQITQVHATPLGEKWVAAMQAILKSDYQLEVPIVDDIHVVNGPALASRAQLYLDSVTKTRVSSSSALIKNRNNNVDIRLKAFVTTIEFKKNSARIINYIQNGVSKTMRARKKVILSAGIHSSKILQLSGIGDEQELRDAGINVVHHNPHVGRNLTNHLLLMIIARVNPADNQEIANNIAFKQIAGMGAVPDPNTTELNERHFEFATVNPAPGISAFAIILNKPESRGYQKIVSNDPLAPLVVDFNYLEEEIDLDRLVTGLDIMHKTIDKLAASDSMYNIISDISNPYEYVKQNATHIHHFSGTNAIGSVVDEKLHVKGVNDLMVADVSVSPTIVRGHTQAAAILIGSAAYTIITGNKHVTF